MTKAATMEADLKQMMVAMGRRLRAARISQDLTQEQMAFRLGTTKQYVSAIERGDLRNPTLGVVLRFAGAYGFTLQTLLALTEETLEIQKLLLSFLRMSPEGQRATLAMLKSARAADNVGED